VKNPGLGLSEEIRACNAVQPFSGCSAELAQGAAEKKLGLGFYQTIYQLQAPLPFHQKEGT
jgi:hypothetical protein